MYKIKFKLNCKGFMVTEILVAITIIALIIAAFEPLLNSSFLNIFSTGRKSSTLYQAQQTTENAIANHGTGSDILVLPFATPIPVQGSYITINELYTDANGNERTVTITSFVPNKAAN